MGQKVDRIYEDTMPQNFPNWMKNTNLHTQDAKKNSKQENLKKIHSQQILNTPDLLNKAQILYII